MRAHGEALPVGSSTSVQFHALSHSVKDVREAAVQSGYGENIYLTPCPGMTPRALLEPLMCVHTELYTGSCETLIIVTLHLYVVVL